ncbi:CAAX protease self-immunity [Longilinea arvoryzae]|uniref:CAAX protease self-immunity n=1 Tax=Longilinea arvoryzae TaxID=360412 RepID=A0A0S7B9J6_9CHLR|nr:CPBP family intramembrane glutamic endopeptidase [Longilinea arvoryzae]GAP13966.1 CAAX protease self-immunity [Longilinea arvoryzae]
MGRVHPLIDWKAIGAIILSTLIMVTDHYHNLFENFSQDMALFYFILPVLFILLVFRESPAEYGLRPGNWKLGLSISAISILGLTFILPFILRLDQFRQYYSASPGQTLPFIFRTTLGMIGWEFFFRGFLLFTLARIMGPYAILIQAIPFTLMHFGKPELETLSCIFGGSAFGYLAWRTKSFFYPFIIHAYLAVMIVLLAK